MFVSLRPLILLTLLAAAGFQSSFSRNVFQMSIEDEEISKPKDGFIPYKQPEAEQFIG